MKCSKLRFWHPDCFRQPLQTILVVKHSLQPIEFDDFAIFAYEKCSFFQSYGKCLEFANTSHDFPIEFDDFPFFYLWKMVDVQSLARLGPEIPMVGRAPGRCPSWQSSRHSWPPQTCWPPGKYGGDPSWKLLPLNHLDHRKNHRKTIGKWWFPWKVDMFNGFSRENFTEKKTLKNPWKNPWFPVKMLPKTPIKIDIPLNQIPSPPWHHGLGVPKCPKMSHIYG